MSLRGGVAEHPPNGGVTLQRNGVTWGDLRRDHDRAVERVLTIRETGQVHLRHQSRTLALSRAWASCLCLTAPPKAPRNVADRLETQARKQSHDRRATVDLGLRQLETVQTRAAYRHRALAGQDRGSKTVTTLTRRRERGSLGEAKIRVFQG
jgi:hypothetical protein